MYCHRLSNRYLYHEACKCHAPYVTIKADFQHSYVPDMNSINDVRDAAATSNSNYVGHSIIHMYDLLYPSHACRSSLRRLQQDQTSCHLQVYTVLDRDFLLLLPVFTFVDCLVDICLTFWSIRVRGLVAVVEVEVCFLAKTQNSIHENCLQIQGKCVSILSHSSVGVIQIHLFKLALLNS